QCETRRSQARYGLRASSRERRQRTNRAFGQIGTAGRDGVHGSVAHSLGVWEKFASAFYWPRRAQAHPPARLAVGTASIIRCGSHGLAAYAAALLCHALGGTRWDAA